MLVGQEEYEDGKLIKALQITGVFKSVLESVRSKVQRPEYGEQLMQALAQLKSASIKDDPQLKAFVKEEADAFFEQGKPMLAAASYLSISDYKGAIIMLLRSNELYLAFYLAKHFYPEALKETALPIAERAEKFFLTDIAVSLVDHQVSKNDTQLANLTKKRLQLSNLIKLSPENDQKAYYLAQAQAQTQVQKRVEMLIMGSDLESGCQVAVKEWEHQVYQGKVDKGYWELQDIVQMVSIHRGVQPEVRNRVMHQCWLAAVWKALWYGLPRMVEVFAQKAKESAPEIEMQQRIASLLDPIVAAVRSNKDHLIPLINLQVHHHTDTLKHLHASFISSLSSHMLSTSHLFSAPLPSSHGSFFHASGYSLTPSTKRSNLSGKLIKGHPYTMEDAKTLCSQEEALEYAMCCRMSYLGNGMRFNPY
ncbi:hypothetical protein FGO68_gene2041 [Halteria grandinella]|uniref:Uncharacterized protein n=1 Tax=Halteria grandinella TaxID=5974 RepID=A0A8J8NDH7_HALGN|nr:hypothetical protein FGO68_gene2041 [Halteria grandinella]